MKPFIIATRLGFIFLIMFLVNVTIFGQDSTSTATTTQTSTTSTTQAWYMSPWAWVGGGVLLIILLIALFSGGNRTEKITVTKTTRTTE